MWTRLWAILLLGTALLPATGSLWLRCGDGRLHQTCCCAGAGADGATHLEPAAHLDAPDCCSFVHSAETARPGRLTGGDGSLAFSAGPPRPVCAAAPALRLPDATAPAGAPEAQLPRAHGPPLYVAHCSLLL